MKRKHLYLLLSILGLCWTWYFNIQFFQTAEDTSITNFIAQCKTTLPAKSIVADISVVVITFFVWMIPEALRLKIKFWWVLIPLTFLIAIAFTFPLFLYLRARKLEQMKVWSELITTRHLEQHEKRENYKIFELQKKPLRFACGKVQCCWIKRG